MDQKVIEKIQKLLSLAGSPNEHEAKLATEKANELLIKFNLNLQDVTKQIQRTYVEHTLQHPQKTPAEAYYVAGIIQSHFFVKVIKATRNRATLIYMIGEETNIQVASYVYEYLIRAYKDCWLKYKAERTRELLWAGKDVQGLSTSKKSYYTGLTSGLHQQLSVKRKTVENETNLVVVKDPELDKRIGHTRTYNHKGDNRDYNASQAGVKDGLTLRIKRGIEAQNGNQGLTLDHKK